jgi:hypothetical protein
VLPETGFRFVFVVQTTVKNDGVNNAERCIG